MFILHPNLESKIFLIDLELCRVLLEDERHYPWIYLVPRRPNIGKIMDLSHEDQLQLLQELDFAQKIFCQQFHPTQLNVAAIGNITPQLHIHVIARFDTDPAWPNTVWNHPIRSPYSLEERVEIIRILKIKFNIL